MPNKLARNVSICQSRSEDTREESDLLDLLVPFMRCMPAFGYSAGQRCVERGLLPTRMLESLNVLNFLAYTVLAAQKAQRVFGVRASVLLAMAIDESAWDVHCLVRDPELTREYDQRSLSPAIERWFISRARSLARSRKYSGALGRAHDVKAFLHSLADAGFCDHMRKEDLLNIIKNHDLQKCDLAGMLDIGQYKQWHFETVTDATGNILRLRSSSDGKSRQTSDQPVGTAAA